MSSRLLVLALLAIALFSVGVGVAAGRSEWLVTVEPGTAYIAQPVTFKAYSYEPDNQTIYEVTCNLTLANATDIIWFNRTSGAPATLTFKLYEPGSYTLYAYCTNERGERYTATKQIIIEYPTPTYSAEPWWGRPYTLTVATPYPYTGVPVAVWLGGEARVGTLVDGRAEFYMPALTEPETLNITLFGVNTTYTLTPIVPWLEADAPQSFYDYASITFKLVDGLGQSPATAELNLSVQGPCQLLTPPPYVTGQTVQVASTRTNPFETEQCSVTAEAELWEGIRITGAATLTIEPATVQYYELKLDNSTLWNWTVMAIVALSRPVAGTLAILLDNQTIAYNGFTGTVATVNASFHILPGTHRLQVKLVSGDGSIEFEPRTIWAPRYPYHIEPPPQDWVWAGGNLSVPNAYHYMYYPSEGTAYLVAYYPGDELYAPATALFELQVVYPKLYLTEDELRVENAAPNSTVEIYCVEHGTERLVKAVRSAETEYTVDLSSYNCPAVKAVYRYGTFTMIAYSNQPEPITLLTTECPAGAPCTLLPEGAPAEAATIAGRTVRPGEPVQLPPGRHQLLVYTRDGYTLPFWVDVTPTPALAVAKPLGDAWTITLEAPPWATVTVALADGTTITLGPGTHRLPARPVAIAWPFGPVLLSYVFP